VTAGERSGSIWERSLTVAARTDYPFRSSDVARLLEVTAQVGPVRVSVRGDLVGVAPGGHLVEAAAAGPADVLNPVILPAPVPLAIKVEGIACLLDRVHFVVAGSVGVGADLRPLPAPGDVLAGPVEVAVPEAESQVLGLLEEPAVGGHREDGVVGGGAETGE